MATGTAQPTVVPPPPPAAEHERFIHKQLGRTSLHVRLIDLAANLAVWGVGILAFLLLAAFVDHWLGGLGVVGRAVALVALVAGSAWFVVTQIGPLLIRGINPSYAARTIEEATPSLKNSLINFLMLRNDRSGVREIVYHAVEAKAAADIAAVPVEATVDRTRLIRAGYVLCGVMAVFAAYKILSPKDPFQTVARVALPWADIARPSRVEISDVQPGTTEVYHGQVVEISATVHGVREGDPVTLLYSSGDGQTVDRAVTMTGDAGGLRFTAELPPPADNPLATTFGGIQQDTTYRIIAGDAETPEFKLSVVSAPTIVIDRLEYQYPAYTKKASESVPQAGDIKALEGTRVTIHAQANQPIKSAWVEFDPGAKDVAPESVQLAFEGTHAWGTIVLQLKADRQKPWHAAYQVRFANANDQQSQQPILHKIDVIRDLAPEVQILQPKRLKVEVPENGSQKLEVRGVDPDYGLSALRIEGKLVGQTDEKAAVAISLLDAKEGQPPQLTKEFLFQPSAHKLKAGDELRYVAIAEDNRAHAITGQPEPNVKRSQEYTIVVIAPTNADENPQQNPNPQPMEGADEPMPGDMPPMPMNGDKPPMQPPQNDQKQNPEEENPEERPGEKNKEPMQGEAGKQGEQQGSKGSKGSKGEKGEQGDKGEKGDKSDDPQSGEPMPGEQEGGDQPMPGEQQGGEGQQGENTQSAGQKGQPKKGEQQKGEQQRGDQQRGDQQRGDQQKGEPMQGGQPEGSQGQAGEQQGGEPQESPEGSGGKSPPESGQQGKPQQGSSSSGKSDGPTQQGSPQQEQPMNDGGAPSGTEQGQAGGQAAGNSDQPAGQEGNPENADTSGQSSGSGKTRRQGKAHEGELIEEVLKEAQQEQGQPEESGQDSQKQLGEQKSGEKSQPMPGEAAADSEAGQEKSQAAGDSGTKSEGAQPGDQQGEPSGAGGQKQPMPSGDQPMQSGGEAGSGEKADPNERLPGDKKGENASQQKSEGGEGGKPMGPDQTSQGEKSESGEGEKKNPGAGQSGDEGAGQKSEDKAGSGEGQEANKDKNKTMDPGESDGQKGEPSPPSGSKRQSDSQGQQSGDQSGGGKQGGGQPSKQKGNDSPGSQSASDEGAGAAEETGTGETGSKAGSQKEASGKTGQSGDKAGDGSDSQATDKGSQGGSKSGDPSGKSEQNPKPDGGKQPGQGGGAGPVVGGGGDVDRPKVEYGPQPEVEKADAANLEYARKATDLVLKKLKDEEHNPDSELLDKLGWSKDDLAEFLRRWESLQKSADKTPEGKRELDEALRSLGLRDPANRQRGGGDASDDQRGLRDAGNRSAPPPGYRDLFDAFRKGAARSSP